MSNRYTAENRVSREDLAVFITGLTDAQLTQSMPAGWTASAVLVHLAFWDQRGLVLLRQWQAAGVSPSPLDTDIVNEVTRPLFQAIPPQEAVRLVLSCAEALDGLIDALDPAFLAEVETSGQTVHLDRAAHRRLHQAEIKAALGLLV